MTAVDYPVGERIPVGSRNDLIAALVARAQRPTRIVGGASAQDRLPAPPREVGWISLAPMRKIVRLEPDDLTCSVEPGLPRVELDHALAEKGLRLPCAGTGSLGGIFARAEFAPLAPQALAARSLLLGIEGVLAEGLPFRAGARVVKSVAGFDVHKLFTGSRGRLFAATLLHLKLRPLPRANAHFLVQGLETAPALGLFRDLRTRGSPPETLVLRRTRTGFAVAGTISGGTRLVSQWLAETGVTRVDAPPELHLQHDSGSEIVGGHVRPSRLGELLQLLPPAAGLLVTGSGQFACALAPEQSDLLLAALPGLQATAEIQQGARERRGRATPQDPAVLGICHRLKRALDPRELLL